MDKNATYQQKFNHLKEWMPLIVDSIKKDLKNEHLKKDHVFVKRYLNNKNINKITNEELASAYLNAIASESGESIGELITSRWLLRHSDLYDFFERHLVQISPNFSDLTELTQEQSKSIVEPAIRQFGAVQTNLFSVLNSVVFPPAIFKDLETRARHQHLSVIEETQRQEEQLSAENMRCEHEREIARLTDKYEKKLAGLQKKYIVDVEALKKQVSLLQRKLNEKV